ncbi:RNA polymerase sigma factor [Thermocatellispora tengchongensis]|uniref:RNA polymerase sigma factor n=1 Tax=Thermocatellispora tengchongensis TaxID=1073253 RepID=UPI00362FA6C4
MTQPSTDQRSRGELIAELYDRHAAGLFAYCLDQLGDADSAADALVSVFAGVTTVQPPRAALYALARREIYRRDIVYAPPSVDPVADPASALIERVLRELRPHQREVLLLSAVCGLEVEELAWVLDVACDTAADLTGSAEHRFLQALKHTLASVGRVPGHLAEIYGALTVAPIRDVLARLPWRPPPPALRAMVHAGLSPPRPAPPSSGRCR